MQNRTSSSKNLQVNSYWLRKKDMMGTQWWIGLMFLQLCFLLGVYSANTPRQGSSSVQSPVKLIDTEQNQVVINNSIVSITLSKPEGHLLGISYAGIENVLAVRNKEDDRGYLDVVWSEPGKKVGTFNRIGGTNYSVITTDENIAEVSFLRTYSTGALSVPVNIDKRYILRKGDSGFYSYVIFERPKGLPAMMIDQTRIVYKLDESFNYMAVSDKMQRKMPSMRDREAGRPLAYPEAVFLSNPSDPQFQGEVDDKYQYSCTNEENKLNGWITSNSKAPVGFWVITPSNEFRNAGPIKQDLTSHVGPTCLAMFTSDHYGGSKVSMAFQEGEPYKKVFGPFFVYLNSAPTTDKFKSLWTDATEKLTKEINSWPYDFPKSKDFLPPNQRGTVTGRLQVQDGGKTNNANKAYVGLALPGEPGSWQIESKGYQFWTRADDQGKFTIKNVVPGKYNLFAWVPGYIGDYKYNAEVTITPGSNIKLDSLVYTPPRNGPTLWEIGIPDRSAGEFFVPGPDPRLINKLYMNDPANNFRQYGLWKRYTEIYPKEDVAFTVGVSNYTKDWFFAHVPRSTTGNTYEATTWKILFDLKGNVLSGKYTLQIALASASYGEVQVWLNDNKGNPVFTTKRIGDDNAVARHGIHGLYWMFSIDVPSNKLVKGMNTIFLRQARCADPFQQVMYDYIRLENPPAA